MVARSGTTFAAIAILSLGLSACSTSDGESGTASSTTRSVRQGVVGAVEGFGAIRIAVTSPSGERTFEVLCARGADFFTDCSLQPVRARSKVVVNVVGEDTRDARSLKGWSIAGAGRAPASCARRSEATCSFTMPEGEVRVTAEFTANTSLVGTLPQP